MKPRIIAHRGVSLNTPENTIPAFEAAIALGADGVETDIQLTKDGRLVLHHNYTIDACSDGVGAICNMTYDQVRRFDFGSYVGEKWKGTVIPNLREFMDTVKELSVVNIELKAPMDRSIPYVETVLSELEQLGFPENVIISAFDHGLLAKIKVLCPQVKVGALMLPAGFSKTPLYSLLERYYPADHYLIDATGEDMGEMDANAFSPAEIGIPGTDARDAVAELARQMGAVNPKNTLHDMEKTFAAQADIPAYVAGLGFKLDYLHCHYSAVLKDPGLVGAMKEMGVLCNVWTPDKPEELAALSKSGCHGIITNRPDSLKKILDN